MTKRNRDSVKRPNTAGQDRSPNQQLVENCRFMLVFAMAATLIAWVLDRPGPILWCIRWGSLLLVLLAIGLMRAFRHRTMDAPGDPRGRLRKRGSTIVVAKPQPKANGDLAKADRLSEPIPSSLPTKPRGFVGWIKFGVPVFGLVLVAVVAAVLAIPEGIRAMITQTAVLTFKRAPPLHLTGATAFLYGVVLTILGSAGLLPIVLVIYGFWKDNSSMRANRLDERNS